MQYHNMQMTRGSIPVSDSQQWCVNPMDCETLWMDTLPPTPQVIVGGNQLGADGNEGYDPYHHLHHCCASSSLSAPPPYVTHPIHSLQACVQWDMHPLCVINFFP